MKIEIKVIMIRLFFVLLFFIFTFIPINAQVASEAYLKGAAIVGIEEEPEFIWAATYGQGIFRFSKEDQQWINFSTKNNNLSNDLFYSIEVNEDYVWAGSSRGLFVYDKENEEWRKTTFSGGQYGNWVRSLYYDESQNVLWIGRFVNLTKLDLAANKFTTFNKTIEGNPRTNNFKIIKADGDSLIWFGTEAGVHIYEKNKEASDKTAWRFISNKNGFKNDGEAVSVSDILFESDYVWFGTDEFITTEQPEFNVGGIYRFNRREHWDRLSKQTGLPANGVYCIEKCGNKIWTSAYYFDRDEKREYPKGITLVDRFSGRATEIDLNKTTITTSKISCLHFDGKNMWIGTDEGLWKIKIFNELARWGGIEKSSKTSIGSISNF